MVHRHKREPAADLDQKNAWLLRVSERETVESFVLIILLLQITTAPRKSLQSRTHTASIFHGHKAGVRQGVRHTFNSYTIGTIGCLYREPQVPPLRFHGTPGQVAPVGMTRGGAALPLGTYLVAGRTAGPAAPVGMTTGPQRSPRQPSLLCAFG